MAIDESKRENLLQDATVYQTRLLFRGQADGLQEHECFVGFRASGGWSIYVGEDPVFQFTQSGQLRRLYWQGGRYMASGEKLIRLQRGVLGGRVRFEQQELTTSEQDGLLAEGQRVLSSFLLGLQTGRLQQVGVVADESEAPFERVVNGLQQVANNLCLASQPNVDA